MEGIERGTCDLRVFFPNKFSVGNSYYGISQENLFLQPHHQCLLPLGVGSRILYLYKGICSFKCQIVVLIKTNALYILMMLVQKAKQYALNSLSDYDPLIVKNG